MRLPRQQRRLSPRDATLPSLLQHAALFVAVVGTVAVGSQFARPTHADAGAARPITALAASLDGRLPDGAPSATAEAVSPRTLRALTVETPLPATALTTFASPSPAGESAPIAAAAAPAQREPIVQPLSRLTATPTPEPVVHAAVIAVPPPSRYATLGEVNVALAQTPWPAELWPRVVAIAICEAGIDSDRDGRYDQVDTQAIGAGGRYIGALQIGADHRFSRPYDLHRLIDNLAAGYELWTSAGGSFAQWGCR